MNWVQKSKIVDDNGNRPSMVYPSLRAPLAAIDGGAAWTLGAPVGVIGAATGIDNSAAVNLGSGLVVLPVTAHGLTTGQWIRVAGTINYNGVYDILNTPTVNTLTIRARYVPEVFTGLENVFNSPPSDFVISYISIEGVPAGDDIFEMWIYKDLEPIAKLRFWTSAATASPNIIPISCPIISEESSVTVRVASASGLGTSVNFSLGVNRV